MARHSGAFDRVYDSKLQLSDKKVEIEPNDFCEALRSDELIGQDEQFRLPTELLNNHQRKERGYFETDEAFNQRILDPQFGLTRHYLSGLRNETVIKHPNVISKNVSAPLLDDLICQRLDTEIDTVMHSETTTRPCEHENGYTNNNEK